MRGLVIPADIPADNFAIGEKRIYKKLYRNGRIFAAGVSRSPAIVQAV